MNIKELGDKPLNYKNSNCAGEYRLASVIKNGTLNPGQWIKIQQYITGYGKAEGIKIVSYVSNNLIDEDVSHLNCTLGRSDENPDKFIWGVERVNLTNHGITWTPGGLTAQGWEMPAFIFDSNDGTNGIITEKSLPEAPLTYNLKLKKDAASGQHFINFYITYFNGERWVCIEEKTPFKINNKFEQFSTTLSVIAAIALIVTIFHDGLYPILESIYDFGRYITNRLSK